MSAPGAVATAALPSRALERLAQAGMFTFGIVMALVGAIVPSLISTLPLSLSDVGTLFLSMNFAILAASLVVGLVMDRNGLKPPIVAGAVLVAVALVLIGASGTFALLLAGVACLGLGGGALNASTNTLVADLHDDPVRKAAALNLLGVFFGFGALMLPFSIGALTSTLGVAPLLYAAASLCAATATAGLALRFPAPKQRHGWPLAELPKFVRLADVRIFAVLLFFQSGNEFLLGGYVASFLTREVGLSVASASYALAAYWGSIMLGRFVLSRVLPQTSPGTVVVRGAAVAAIGTALVPFAFTPAFAVAAVLLSALALAGIFPSVLGLVGSRYHERSGTVFGILFTVALTGGMTIPWLAGQVADTSGIRWVFAMASAGFVVIALLGAAGRRAIGSGAGR
jgi:fucose permease